MHVTLYNYLIKILQMFRTPLHAAASSNNLDIARLLVDNGACILALTFTDKETPPQKCSRNVVGFEDCSQFLNGKTFGHRMS